MKDTIFRCFYFFFRCVQIISEYFRYNDILVALFLMFVASMYKWCRQCARMDPVALLYLFFFGPEMYGQSRELFDYIGAQPMWSRCIG